MIRRKLLTLSILLASFIPSAMGQTLPAGGVLGRFVLGVEWGYTQCLYHSRNYNFISEEGYRIYEKNSSFYAHANAQILASLGYRLSDQVTLAFYSGYIGVGEQNRLIPALLRASYFPSTDSEDGLFAYVQGGTAWHVHSTQGRMAWLGTLGGGYRLRLSTDTRLDLLVGLKYLHDHPSIPNPEGPGNVPEHNIRMNNAGYCALDISLAISF